MIYNSRNYRSILASIKGVLGSVLIYNSRNYRSILAKASDLTEGQKSTIVEIIEAY